MSRGYAFQQQQSSYALHKESQQQSYAVHKEARYARSDFHGVQNHILGMPIVPSVCLDAEVMKHKAMFDGAFDTGQNLNQHVWSHGFGGGKMLMPLLNPHGAMSNNAIRSSEFETLKEVVGQAAGAMRMQEMRYESSSWGGNDHALNYNFFDNGVNWKRNSYSRYEWTSKGN